MNNLTTQSKKQILSDLIEAYLPENLTIDDFTTSELATKEDFKELYNEYMKEV